jgi:hypothetical protein
MQGWYSWTLLISETLTFPTNKPQFLHSLKAKIEEWDFPAALMRIKEKKRTKRAHNEITTQQSEPIADDIGRRGKRERSPDAPLYEDARRQKTPRGVSIDASATPGIAGLHQSTKIFVNYTISQDCTASGDGDSKRLLSALQGRDGAKRKNLLCALQGRPRDLKIRSRKLFPEEVVMRFELRDRGVFADTEICPC